tara:strand:+ start:203 stop:505 length:303 start_codon:yes stop_codon:yes gene_type:complete
MLDTQSKETLEVILAKDKTSLTEDERRFLRARRSYLNDEQTERFAKILGDEGEGDATDGLDALKKDELVALAEANEVSLEGATTNADRVAKLREAGVSAE